MNKFLLCLLVFIPFLSQAQTKLQGVNVTNVNVNFDQWKYEKSLGAVFIWQADRGVIFGPGTNVQAWSELSGTLNSTHPFVMAYIQTNQPVVNFYSTNLLGQPMRAINTAGNPNVHLKIISNPTISNMFSGIGKPCTIFTIVNPQQQGTASSVSLSWANSTNSGASRFTARPLRANNDASASWAADTNQSVLTTPDALDAGISNTWFFHTVTKSASSAFSVANLTRGTTLNISTGGEQTLDTISFGNAVRGTGGTYVEHDNVHLNTVIVFTNNFPTGPTNIFIGGTSMPPVTNFHKYYNTKVPLMIVP